LPYGAIKGKRWCIWFSLGHGGSSAGLHGTGLRTIVFFTAVDDCGAKRRAPRGKSLTPRGSC